MAPGMGIKAPVPRTRTGCLTCRKRKVKCDEAKPICGRCHRLQRECAWSDELQVIPHRRTTAGAVPSNSSDQTLQLSTLANQNFVIEFPNLDRSTVPYMHHFITFCCRFLAYSNDNEGNPFQEDLIPLASSSPALLHAMTALAAGHLSRSQPQHLVTAVNHYSMALRELNGILSDPVVAKSDSTLGACLLLCVYEICQNDSSLWLEHLQGARDLIMFRGGPSTSDYLTRFFSFLDISGSLSSGGGPLLQGNYWIEDDPSQDNHKPSHRKWPYYDSESVMTDHFHVLMTYMARLARLSAQTLSTPPLGQDETIAQAELIRDELLVWWRSCPPALRDQSNDWRTRDRPKKLTVSETLEEESLSSTKSCKDGCIIYLNHILDPHGHKPQKPEVIEAVGDILEIAKEMPRGYGLEMGLYWGLFMAGVAIYNDVVAEEVIRAKLKADSTSNIYHADRALELLEVLWKRQHQYSMKFDWRQVQTQMGIHIFILA